MLNGGHIVQIETGKTISSTDASYEFNQSEYADFIDCEVIITGASSLTDAFIRLEEYSPLSDTWVTAVQEVAVVAITSGTPDVANENTASTTAVTGGVSRNVLGITDIDDNGTFRLRKVGNGKRTRLFTDAASGTGTLKYSAVMKRSFNY